VSLKPKENPVPIYMNYNDIKGDVSAEGHENWIEVHSFQWGVGRGISSPTGASADRESSAPSISEIVVTKSTDLSSPKLLDEALQGEGQKVVIDFVKTDKGKLEVYMTYTLEDCMISGYSLSSGGDRPSESLSLNFTKVEFKNVAMKDKNDAGEPESVTYDLALGKIV
jgi:type VI secretion system secreted protein Hcp